MSQCMKKVFSTAHKSKVSTGRRRSSSWMACNGQAIHRFELARFSCVARHQVFLRTIWRLFKVSAMLAMGAVFVIGIVGCGAWPYLSFSTLLLILVLSAR